eukprot:TRINITY_DN36269_c0_g1_i1.p2 TRINITY_DN36269_c0_g1~~TRINITY_DN36269_c0_g1_i1.p2  ORF type:complete len:378 (+),score=156.94 TRINITY_DN36269_c0_g1_i1:74-1207(+)
MAVELRAIKYERGTMTLLDQKKLPMTTHYDAVVTAEDAWEAIRDMRVRGAPAIAIAAALGLAVEAHHKRESFESPAACAAFLAERLDYLSTSRPTAVNLHNAVRDLKAVVSTEAARSGATSPSITDAFITASEKMLADDERDNAGISEHGSAHILANCAKGADGKVKIVTICNTGALATSRYGTALGVVRFLHNKGALERVFPLETRPYNQGGRLTTYECVAEGMAATLIVDSAVSYLMSKQKVSACIVGADRVCVNGDTANKIGTYNVAVAAKHHGIPFYVAAPVTTIDQSLADGSGIPVEERSTTEITHNPLTGDRVVADGPTLDVWNPSFDVTPAELITGGIVTEIGVIEPKDGKLDVLGFLESVNPSKRARHN